MVEKLAKALDGLKHLQFTTSVEEKNISKKEKMLLCVLAADVMVSVKPTNLQNLPVVIENMINLCDDDDSDVRMVADESLNRVIMSLSESNMPKAQLELHKVIKKNGPARCLRAALSRFGQLSQYVRPNKGRVHVQMLVPSLIEISKREEESIHETLAASFDHIFQVLGVFIQDNSLKGLLKAFLHNLSNVNPVIRRSSATCIIKLVHYCRKPHIFNSYVLNSLLDCVVPVCENNSTDLILGVLGCLRLLLPSLASVRHDEGISGSFGLRKKQEESYFSVDRLIQTYELCLHYTKSKDHNVVTAALETLNQILQNPPQQLETFFLSPAGFSRSYIQLSKENKLWSRSGSEMSVACPLPPMDESLLVDDSEILSQFGDISGKQFSSIHFSKSKDKFKFSEDDGKIIDNPFRQKVFGKMYGSQGTLDNDSDTESSIVSGVNTPPLLLSTEREELNDREIDDFVECSGAGSQENLYSPTDSEGISDCLPDADTGCFTDAAVPLIYCVRHLATSFLLGSSPGSLKPDRNVRVSIKSLAFSCISAAVKLYPVVLKMNLSKSTSNGHFQEISDILLFSDHSDPQIRGSVSVLIGSFIRSALLECKGFDSDWLNSEKSKLNSRSLIEALLKGLKDKTSVCNRQSLSAVKMFLSVALTTSYNVQVLPLLEYLPVMSDNSYWLVKVKLLEVFSDLPYGVIQDLFKSRAYQDEVIDFVFLPLLGDEDARVRSAASESLVRIVPMLSYENSPILDYTKAFMAETNKWLKAKIDSGNGSSFCSPFSHAFQDPEESGYNNKIEISLSFIVAKLTNSLMVAENKNSLFGYVEALKLLSEKYPTTAYPKSWNCTKRKKTESLDSSDFLTSDLITFVHSLLVASPTFLDLTAISNATFLLGNLFAGHSISNLKSKYHAAVPSDEIDGSHPLWNVFNCEKLSIIAEEIFTHLLKVLNLYSCLAEEITLSHIAESSITGNALAPLLSPIKKQEKKMSEKLDEKKGKTFSQANQSTHYARLQQLLKSAHTTYKVSLDKPVGDKFLDCLESTLYALSILLEVSTVQETGRCADEILTYLRAVVAFRATPAILCVIQLLKTFFGTNLASNWENKKLPVLNYRGLNLFDTIFQLPPRFLSEKIRSRSNVNSLECENLNGRHWRSERKFFVRHTDKNWLATYIRLLEPMVVKSLQLYTTTRNVKLQSTVLQLLNQLIQLRVNYCLLDEKQVFVGFVLKQFELIEHGQIPEIELLLPHIFKFFVLLSYEKQHSKPIISVPKILQLCDGLMASDQPVQTHCIPALIPVVDDIFIFRNPGEDKELETQREVLLSMLLRVAEFPPVMDMLAKILNETRTLDEKEKWKRWSRQVMDVMLNLTSQDRLQVETFEGQNSFVNLMSSLSPNVLRPIDPLLKVLFIEPNDNNCCTTLNRWLSRVTVVLESILFVKEDVLLNRLEEISPNVNLNNIFFTTTLCSPNPFNVDSFFQVYEPSETVARFLLKTVSLIAYRIVESFAVSFRLQQKLSMFFICIYQIVQSGTFHRITNSMRNLLTKDQDSLFSVFSLFKKLTFLCPLLTCQFSYMLTLLNYCDQEYWKNILVQPVAMSAKLVQWCGLISLADYLCDNLSDADTLRYLLQNNLQEILLLSHEIPIKELLMTIRRRKTDWRILMDAVTSMDLQNSEPRLVEKVLRVLEMTETGHSVSLLCLLVDKFLAIPHMALSLLAGSIARREVEFLLTLPKDKVLEEINEISFRKLMKFFDVKTNSKRHFNLWNLLKRLGVKVFESDFMHSSSQCNLILTDNYNEIQLKQDWLFSQVKIRCCQRNSSGPEIATLLTKLNGENISKIFSSPDFNLKILINCLTYSRALRRNQGELQEDGSSEKTSGLCESLFVASKQRLLECVSDIACEVINRCNSNSSARDVLKRISEDEVFLERIWNITPSLTFLLEIIYDEDSDVENETADNLLEFAFLCVTIVRWICQKQRDLSLGVTFERNFENAFKCSAAILKSQKIKVFLGKPSNRERLKSLVQDLYSIICHLIPNHRLNRLEENLKDEHNSTGLRFMLEFVTSKTCISTLPKFVIEAIRDLILTVCRIPALSLSALRVPETGDLQDIECFEAFISRFSIIGWGNKQQFEEIWVALLAVLGFNTQGDIPAEESKFIVQASAVAVEGITTLLKNTMLDSSRKKLIHHGRDHLSMKNIYKKLPLVDSIHKKYVYIDRAQHFLDNLEISVRDDRYVYGLLSVEYLWTAVKQITSQVDLYNRHSEQVSQIGLDLPSCIYFLTELYSQWIYQSSPDIKIISSSLKSSIVISDLFTDISQFQWLLNFCLRIDEIVVEEDAVLLPLIIKGSAKAAAIVLPDFEVCERIKKMMLRCENAACRTATVQALLYLLQSYVVCYAVNHTTLPPSGSTFQREEANFVVYIVDNFLPVALEIAQQFKHEKEKFTDEYERCHWSLIFYLLQNYQSSLGDLKDEFISFIFSTLRSKNCSEPLMGLLVRGIERLLLTTVIDDVFKDQVSKISLDIISQNSVTTCSHGLQLLAVLSFLDKRAKDIRQLVTGQEDPEKVMKDMEKINVLFEKLKKSYPKEADIVGDVLSYILMDFTASDVLTKVIQEFLSPQQPHQKILASLLFKVFERAELSLLEDWVVFTLPSFIQGMPISMSVWILNCFFVSASNEPWLRSLFPLVKSRIRMAEDEDKKLLCLSGTLFYKQLKHQSQKKSFVSALEKVSKMDAVFVDLLLSLKRTQTPDVDQIC